MESRPLSEGNWVQRRYARLAARSYDKLTPTQRRWAERVDGWLYSRRGWPAWLGLPAAAAVLAWLTPLTLPGALLLVLLGAFVTLVVWFEVLLYPERFERPRQFLTRTLLVWMLWGSLGAFAGFAAVWDWAGRGFPEWARLAFVWLVSALVLVLLGALQWTYAAVRRRRLEQQLTVSRLAQEREAAARELAETRLRLLQAQVHPHFIFNTLSAVQHWVDQGDARASTLLRSLTAFLRGATELLGRERTTIGEEAAMVGHYLAIMQARLGGRLASRIDVPAELAGVELPPGLLLTLVENAVEHGIEPALAGGCVSVVAARDPAGQLVTLSVRDDGSGLAADTADGVGIPNCRQRLLQFFGAAARLEVRPRERGTEAVMSWPLPGAPAAVRLQEGGG